MKLNEHQDQLPEEQDKNSKKIGVLLWSCLFGVWGVWFSMSWACVAVAIFSRFWEGPALLWLTSALLATACRRFFFIFIP